MIKKNHLKKRNQFPRGGRHLLNTHCAPGLILEDMIKKMQTLLLQGSEQQNEARDLTYRKMASQTQGHENLMFCIQQYLQDESGCKRYPGRNLDQAMCWSMRCRPNQREETTKCKDYSEHIKTVDVIGEAGELWIGRHAHREHGVSNCVQVMENVFCWVEVVNSVGQRMGRKKKSMSQEWLIRELSTREKKELVKELGRRRGNNILMELVTDTAYSWVKMKKEHGIWEKYTLLWVLSVK